jgi:hypothetical protein
MSGYNQNYTVSAMPQVASAAAAHSGPYAVREAMEGALVIISGLTGETVAVQISPDGTVFGAPTAQATLGNGAYVVDLRGAVAYKFVKSAGAETATITHSLFRYS